MDTTKESIEIEVKAKVDTKPLDKARKAVQDYQNKLRGLSDALLNVSLSVLFFGMAIKKLATSIIKSAVTSFNKITYGAEGAGGALGVLNVHFELLKYTLGAAIDTLLQAFLPTILEVILAVQDWIEQNPALAAGILIFVAAIGSLMVVLGTVTSLFTGVVKAIALFSEGGSLAGTITAASLGTVLTVIALIIAALVLLYAAWKSNFGGIREFTSKTFTTIKEIFETTFGFILRTLGNIMDIITGILEGDWGKVGAALVRIFSDAIKTVMMLWSELGAVTYNIMALAINGIKDLFLSLMTLIPTGVKKLYEMLGFDDKAKQIQDYIDTLNSFRTSKGFGIQYKTGKEMYDQNFGAGNPLLNFDALLTKGASYGKTGGASPVDTATQKTQEFATTVTESNNKLLKSAELLVQEEMNAVEALKTLTKVQKDATLEWTNNQFALQKALGIHKQGQLNYQTGTYLGNEVMRSMFGDYTAGLGQFQSGVSKKETYQEAQAFADARGGDYRGAPAGNITIVNKNQNGGTYVTGASGTGTMDRAT